MAEARVQAELVQTKADLQRLRDRVSIGTPTIHKDLSLISLVHKWSGSETAVPLEEFFLALRAQPESEIGRTLINFKWQYSS